jgi:hypothetical protein
MARTSLHAAALAIAAGAAATTHAGDIVRVPDDHRSIGAAIATAQPGDTIVVADGLYTGPENRDLSFGGKDLVVRSANGPLKCIIDCQGQGRGFIFDDGETRAAVLEGFTIRNGSAPEGNGGGIDIALSTHPTIRNCVLRENTSLALGGGIAVRGQCAPVIDRCVFIDNWSFGTVESSEGGGLSLFFLSPALVTNCVFIGNESEYGGGLACALSDATIVNCLFVGNSALIGGGAVASDVSNPRLVNCTMTGNTAFYGGGAAGISQILESDLTIANSILWGNGPNEIQVLNGVASVRYSDVAGGWPGEGNIDADPAFVGQTLVFDPAEYALATGSPCIDVGDSAAVPAGVVTDLAGAPRFVDDPATPDGGSGGPPVVDMGVFELQVASCHGDVDGSGDVDLDDLLAVLAAWGPCPGCAADLDDDGVVGLDDLLAVLAAWGPCP